MAIVKCRECGGQVSTKAVACPHCGAVNPAEKQAALASGSSASPKKKSSTVKTVLIVVAVLWVIGTVANLSSERTSTRTAAPAPEPIAGLCNKQPLEIFPVGEKFESDALSRRTDANCPNARFHADERIEVSYNGQQYFIQTKKLNYSGPAYYEIISIRAAER